MTVPTVTWPFEHMQLPQFASVYQREHATTRKVLHAFPADQAELRPHERSFSARQLAWLFVGEELMMLKALRGQPVLGGGFASAPDRWEEVLERFDAAHAEMTAQLESAGGALAPVRFYTGPGQIADYPAMEFIWLMLRDQIHHRGQLSVYLRMAGGKVPSIYGPSGDEPWV